MEMGGGKLISVGRRNGEGTHTHTHTERHTEEWKAEGNDGV